MLATIATEDDLRMKKTCLLYTRDPTRFIPIRQQLLKGFHTVCTKQKSWLHASRNKWAMKNDDHWWYLDFKSFLLPRALNLSAWSIFCGIKNPLSWNSSSIEGEKIQETRILCNYYIRQHSRKISRAAVWYDGLYFMNLKKNCKHLSQMSLSPDITNTCQENFKTSIIIITCIEAAQGYI